ncbi:uncharacterized protein LOC141618905 [Silene latifolia]|uniref:uncharacterized protein LOC141618905 n=1 Tax=Silene latifolia TaxID=37657 RepID=UPI003D782998
MCMKYLTRLIKFATEKWPFQYHPLCKSLKLTHLMFADDLLLFCKGNAHSVMLLMRAFSSFSDATGLNMNNTKSEIFFNGMDEVLQEDIKRVTGFCEGQMPFRYLGVPIQSVGGSTKKECNSLTEKMVGRIRSLGAKKLSYAGRLTLINSVLNTLYSYWASMFIIPKSVIKRIEAICRNYLWDDRLWIRWINQVYIKQQQWHTYKPPATAPWSWKNVCKVKELLKDGFTDDTWTAQTHGYSIRGGYYWLVMPHPILDWTKMVWNSWNTPKHSMITWITLHGGLNIKDKFSRIRGKLESWLGRPMPNVNDMVAGNTGSIQWKIMAVVMNAYCYNVWLQRNNARINNFITRPEIVAKRIEEEAMRRIKFKAGPSTDQASLAMLRSVGLQ